MNLNTDLYKFIFGRLKTIKIDNVNTINLFGCRQGYCDKVFTDFDNHFLKEDENWLETIEIIKTYDLIVELNNYKRDKKHWCFSNEREFCK